MKYPIIARNFITALSANNMTQQELANISGIGKSSISHYCHGTHCPDNLRAKQLADILNVNPLWLMGLEDKMHIETPTTTDSDGRDEKVIKEILSLTAEEIDKTLDYVEYLKSRRT